jgi:hypothetical protein
LLYAVPGVKRYALRGHPQHGLRIQGAIRYYNDSPVPGAAVTFEGDNISKTVSADKNGFYETDLPVGLYTMTAQDLSKWHYKYLRPPFRVASSTGVTLNVTFYAGLSWASQNHLSHIGQCTVAG